MHAVVLVLFTNSLPVAAEPPKAPRYTAKLRKADDRFEAVTGPTGVVLRITSKSGIGSAQIHRTEGPAPAQLTLHLVGLRTLEAFNLTDGKRKVSGSLARDGARTVRSFDKAGKVTSDPKATAVTLAFEKKAGMDVIVVTITHARGVTPGARWDVRWVDAYR
jgi:hypothetical protein